MTTGAPTAIPVAKPLTPEWYEARANGIGASEIAAAAGLSKWAQPLDIYLRKVGKADDKPDNDAMRLGRKLEPVIKSEFVERTGLQLIDPEPPMFRHADYPQIFATPDALVSDGNGLECKSTNWRIARDELGDEASDHVPTEWLCQAQMQMFVLDVDIIHVAALVDGRDLRCHQVTRNDRLIRGLVKAACELWERIINRDPPPVDWTHSNTPQLVKEMYTIETGKTIVLPDEFRDLWEQQAALGRRTTEEAKERDRIRAKILAEMGDAEIAILPGCDYTLTRKEIHKKGYTVEPSVQRQLIAKKVK